MTGQGRNFYYIWPVGRRYILILRKRVQCQNWTAVKKQTNKPALDGICQDCCIPRKTRLQLREREVNRGREMGFQRAVKLFLSLFSYPRGKKKEKRKNLASVYRMSLSISSSMRFDIVSIIYARLGKELGPWSARLINDFRGHSPLSLSLSLRCCCYVVYNTMLSDWQPPISPPWVAPRGAHQLQPILCTCPCAFLRLFLLPFSFYRLISQHGDWQRCETKGGLAAWNAGYRIQGVAQPTPRVSVCRFFRVHLSISRLHTSSSPLLPISFCCSGWTLHTICQTFPFIEM